MGGMIGQVLALRIPACFRALFFAILPAEFLKKPCPFGRNESGWPKKKGWTPLQNPRWKDGSQRPSAGSRCLHWTRSGYDPNDSVKGYVGCSRAIMRLNLTERLREITLPSFIIVGEEDPGTPVAASQVIHEQIKGSELVILKSAAHLSNIEQQDAFNTAVMAFLKRLA